MDETATNWVTCRWHLVGCEPLKDVWTLCSLICIVLNGFLNCINYLPFKLVIAAWLPNWRLPSCPREDWWQCPRCRSIWAPPINAWTSYLYCKIFLFNWHCYSCNILPLLHVKIILPVSPLSPWTKTTSCPLPLFNFFFIPSSHIYTGNTTTFTHWIMFPLNQLNVGPDFNAFRSTTKTRMKSCALKSELLVSLFFADIVLFDTRDDGR